MITTILITPIVSFYKIYNVFIMLLKDYLDGECLCKLIFSWIQKEISLFFKYYNEHFTLSISLHIIYIFTHSNFLVNAWIFALYLLFIYFKTLMKIILILFKFIILKYFILSIIIKTNKYFSITKIIKIYQI